MSIKTTVKTLFARPGRFRTLLIVGAPLAFATGFKLWLALTTVGTNDVRYWHTFMDYIVARGSVTIYRDIWYYNHPPMMSGLLKVLSWRCRTRRMAFPSDPPARLLWRTPSKGPSSCSAWSASPGTSGVPWRAQRPSR